MTDHVVMPSGKKAAADKKNRKAERERVLSVAVTRAAERLGLTGGELAMGISHI